MKHRACVHRDSQFAQPERFIFVPSAQLPTSALGTSSILQASGTSLEARSKHRLQINQAVGGGESVGQINALAGPSSVDPSGEEEPSEEDPEEESIEEETVPEEEIVEEESVPEEVVEEDVEPEPVDGDGVGGNNLINQAVGGSGYGSLGERSPPSGPTFVGCLTAVPSNNGHSVAR